MDLIIKRGGKLYVQTWSNQQYIEKPAKSDLMDYLTCPCEIEPGVKFSDICELVKSHCKQLTYILTNGPWLSNFIEEAGQEPVIDENDNEHIDYLEVYWIAEIWDEVCEGIGFHGIGNDRYALDFSPLNTLTHYEVRLNKKYELYNHKDKHSDTPLISSIKPYTLLDILRGIFWDLSFHGGPDERQAMKDSIIEAASEMKEVESVKELMAELNKDDIDPEPNEKV